MATTQQNSAFALDLNGSSESRNVPSGFGRALRTGLGTLIAWQQRSVERQHLATLSDFHLNDMGLTRADVDHETSKPFWQA